MPRSIPKLNKQLELRFYRQNGMTGSTIYARLEARSVEYAARWAEWRAGDAR